MKASCRHHLGWVEDTNSPTKSTTCTLWRHLPEMKTLFQYKFCSLCLKLKLLRAGVQLLLSFFLIISAVHHTDANSVDQFHMSSTILWFLIISDMNIHVVILTQYRLCRVLYSLHKNGDNRVLYFWCTHYFIEYSIISIFF